MSEVKIGMSDKLHMELLPVEAMVATTRAIDFGAKKYAPRGWEESARRGEFAWSVSYGALLRHLTRWFAGEDTDPESGLHHLDHAGANLAFLQTFVERRHGEDDRPTR